MWMWHHNMGYGVLLQDVQSLTLRVLPIPDDERFYRQGNESEEVVNKRSEELVSQFVAQSLQPRERRVPLSEFVHFEDWDERRPTLLPCPQCRTILSWRNTGIS